MSPSAPVVIRPAATVILLREKHAVIEALMTLRHSNLAFMGGQWVFPGGAVAPSDTSDAALALVSQHDTFTCKRMRTLQGQPLPLNECLGLAIAACRETFEETGVLLASHANGRPCEPAALSRLQSQRTQITQQPTLFLEMLAEEQLQLDLQRLIYWAHWITPSNSSRRFDTRFFAIAAPDSHEVSADAGETAEYRWQSPAASLDAARQGAMPMPPPTLRTLRELQESISRHRTLDALLRAEASRPVAPILPKIVRDNERTAVVMPWDEGYAQAPGEGAAYDIGNRGTD
ncbi:MAG TPA: hypothetical protein VGN07_15600 [Steroidobacteraceae bacterium]|jgi:8-oxo-dGTP pyrophosphatase MutT (NUDIX family)